MTRLQTNHIATMTKLREPFNVLERSGGKPVAIMKNSRCVGCLVPVEATQQVEPRQATREDVMKSLARHRHIKQPVLDYLNDK